MNNQKVLMALTLAVGPIGTKILLQYTFSLSEGRLEG